MSSSTYVLSVKDSEYTMVPDVEKDNCNFTDGCGYISQKFMETIKDKFQLNSVSAI